MPYQKCKVLRGVLVLTVSLLRLNLAYVNSNNNNFKNVFHKYDGRHIDLLKHQSYKTSLFENWLAESGLFFVFFQATNYSTRQFPPSITSPQRPPVYSIRSECKGWGLEGLQLCRRTVTWCLPLYCFLCPQKGEIVIIKIISPLVESLLETAIRTIAVTFFYF